MLATPSATRQILAMKVFISSVIGGFEQYRDAAVSAVQSLGHNPIRAEDYGASPASPQQVCLQGVRDSQVVVLLMGRRYGAKQGAGISATHEEYREARHEGKDMLAFVQQGVAPEPDQQEFIREVQDWGSGLYTETFTTTEGLRDAVIRRLHEMELARAAGQVDEQELLSRAQASFPERHQAQSPTLYVTVSGAPRRQVISPAELEQEDLQRKIVAIASTQGYSIFDFRGQTRPTIRENALVLEQDQAAIALDELGTVMVRQSAQNRERNSLTPGANFLTLDEGVVRERLERALRFAGTVLDDVDAVRRLTDIAIVARLIGASYQTWRRGNTTQMTTQTAGTGPGGGPMVATPEPPIQRRAALYGQVTQLVGHLLRILPFRALRRPACNSD